MFISFQCILQFLPHHFIFSLLLQNCAILLKNTKQKKLLVSHLNDVLEVYEAPPLYGHAYFHESNFIYVPAAGVFVPQEHTVSLVPLATSKTPISQPKEPSIEGIFSPLRKELINKFI